VSRAKHAPDPAVSLPDQLSFSRPKGAQLREILEDLMSTLRPGELLPSERVLAERFGVARMTVRQEIDQLVAEGLVYRRHGHGTFVAGTKLVQSDTLRSFSQEMRARGMTPGARVLSVAVEPARPHVAAQMEISPGSQVLHVVRLRTADGTPMALERAHLPAERFPGLEAIDLSDNSLWEELERRWGVQVGSAQQRVSAVLPDREEAALLQIPGTQPCFSIRGVTRDTQGLVIEYGPSLYRGDRYDVQRHAQRA
jgi:GntR family transcriptional regulator